MQLIRPLGYDDSIMAADDEYDDPEWQGWYRSLMQEISKLHRVRQQTHIENVQIAIASLIVGSYFTETAQSMEPIGNNSYTDIIILVAAAFLLVKLVTLSARETGLSRLERLAGSAIGPLVFTVAVVGYAILIVSQFLPDTIATNAPTGLLLLVLLAVFGSGISVVTYWRTATGLAMYADALRDPTANLQRAMKLVSEFPQVIEPGLKISAEDQFERDMGVDFVGEDADGRTVAIEVKWLTKPSSLRFSFGEYQDILLEMNNKFERVILATNTELHQSQSRKLRDIGIDCRVIDEYQVFGRLSEFFRWLDRKTGILS